MVSLLYRLKLILPTYVANELKLLTSCNALYYKRLLRIFSFTTVNTLNPRGPFLTRIQQKVQGTKSTKSKKPLFVRARQL